jgi:hypothetical protein
MSNLIEVKAVELIGPALDWAVAQLQIQAGEITADSEEHSTGRPYFTCKFANPSIWGAGREKKGTFNTQTGRTWVEHGPGGDYSPSTRWSQCGQLIDKYKPWLSPPVGNDQDDEPYGWDAEIYSDDGFEQIAHIVGAPTALIAICRAIVFAKLGETVKIPVELMQ